MSIDFLILKNTVRLDKLKKEKSDARKILLQEQKLKRLIKKKEDIS